MKKKLLSVAALAALAGGINTAQAVYVNADGLGQTLLYPYYTAESGNDTYINVVNTTDRVKAVKVRFVEGMNSVEVLDFNLYLSPKDHWSAVVTANADGAIVKTVDTSCTVPAIPAAGQPFSTFLFKDDSVNGADRTRAGYVEIIEMGTVDDFGYDEGETNLAVAATHVDGVPANCGALRSAWASGGVWSGDTDSRNPTRHMSGNMGGLYGYGVLINVNEGTDATYDAIALDDFVEPYGRILHAAPGNSSPALNSADPFAVVIDGDNIWEVDFEFSDAGGLDAVSAVLMHDAIMNDFVLEPTISAGTDWVVTMPTKHDYVNQGRDSNDDLEPAIPPFTEPWDDTISTSCEKIGIVYYDREERHEIPDVGFSPTVPGGEFALCAEANVLTFTSPEGVTSDVLGNVAAGGKLSADLSVIYNNGWVQMGFSNDLADTSGRYLVGDDDTEGWDIVVFEGLPVMGFAVQKYSNGTLVVGGQSVLSNYAGTVKHKSTRNIFGAYIEE